MNTHPSNLDRKRTFTMLVHKFCKERDCNRGFEIYNKMPWFFFHCPPIRRKKPKPNVNLVKYDGFTFRKDMQSR